MLQLDDATQSRLLGRAAGEVLTDGDRRCLQGQHALVTGAGGSVGRELARQLAHSGVGRLTLMDHSEYALFSADAALRESYPGIHIIAVLGDVTRMPDMRAAAALAQPHVVYHAAAYKHVTFAETAIVQAMRVNVLGAVHAARVARAAGARFVLISSDKAAEPRSVMGATKRCAELLVLGEATPSFRPLAVRFGNVLGSSGSVVEIMFRRAREGRSLPVTDPDASRYFMTGAEAVSLVLKADLIGTRPGIFWLDMGEPVRIGDLAARVAALVRAEGGPAVAVDVIGLRPGEKRHEELTSQGLSMEATAHDRILSAVQRPLPDRIVPAALRKARRACARASHAMALAMLTELLDDYQPSAAAWAVADEAPAA